jgi:hypothetical protein
MAMRRYIAGGAAGAASSTAATAGLLKIDNPSANDLTAAAIRAFSIGPAAAAEDSNYTVQLKRQTTAGTWTAVTASPVDADLSASITTAGRLSTAAGSASTVITLGGFGFNQRSGIRIMFDPGGEPVLADTASNGIILEYTFVQGTAVNNAMIEFME